MHLIEVHGDDRDFSFASGSSVFGSQMVLQVQISWQAQHFGNPHVQISWQPKYKMRCGDIGKARNAVAPKLASQGLRNDGCGMVSGHAGILLGIVHPLRLEFSLAY